MRSAILVLPMLLSSSSIALGSLVVNPENPITLFHESDARILTESDYDELHLDSVKTVLGNDHQSRFSLILTNLFSTRYSSRNSSKLYVETDCAVTRRLKHSTQFLDDICGSLATRKWIEKYVLKKRFPKVYLVVGLLLVTDAQVKGVASRSGAASAGNHVPVSAIAAPVATSLSVSVSAEFSTKNHDTSYTAIGEQVYAIEYRKIEFNWLFSHKIEKAKIEEGSRWQVYARPRGQNDEEDVVQAVLKEETCSEDFGFPCEELEHPHLDESLIIGCKVVNNLLQKQPSVSI